MKTKVALISLINKYDNDLMIPSAVRWLFVKGNSNKKELIKNLTILKNVEHGNILDRIKRDCEDSPEFFGYDIDTVNEVNKLVTKIFVDKVNVDKKSLIDMINYFYRASIYYAVGRMTYIVSDAVIWTKSFCDILSEEVKTEMIEYISERIDKGRAGMFCDIESWNETIKILKGF